MSLSAVRRTARKAADARHEFELAIRAAHDAGWTTRAIAKDAGLSHQRVHQILHGK
jgi:hypothetical protein